MALAPLDVQTFAAEYRAAGISVIPLTLDGQKKPAIGSWQPYQHEIAGQDQIDEWFVRPAGIGIVCGTVSGGLEAIDFDMAELFWPWFSGIQSSLQKRLTVVETPGGWHVLYRCREICGNRKLAMWEHPQTLSEQRDEYRQGTGLQPIGKGVRIETRGEGGYIVGEGSPAQTHSTGRLYAHSMGPQVLEVQYVTPDERRTMWHAAMEFDCTIDRQSAALREARRRVNAERHGAPRRDITEPWTWFDLNGPPIIETLSSQGWQTKDGQTLTRPGKSFGTSAVVSLNDAGEEVLTVYSTSCGALSPISGQAHASFGKFNLLVAAEFRGDRKEAARHVRKMMQSEGVTQ